MILMPINTNSALNGDGFNYGKFIMLPYGKI